MAEAVLGNPRRKRRTADIQILWRIRGARRPTSRTRGRRCARSPRRCWCSGNFCPSPWSRRSWSSSIWGSVCPVWGRVSKRCCPRWCRVGCNWWVRRLSSTGRKRWWRVWRKWGCSGRFGSSRCPPSIPGRCRPTAVGWGKVLGTSGC